MTATRKRRSSGRYDLDEDAAYPANGIAPMPKGPNVQGVIGTVDDPMEAGNRVKSRINARVDILEQERSHGRISEGAYRVGREIQATFERASRIGAGSQWREGDRVDASFAKEVAIHRNLDVARKINNEVQRLTAEVGTVGATFLRDILVGGCSFANYTARHGAVTKRDVHVTAGRFRQMLEEIVQCRAARGGGTSRQRYAAG